MINMLRNNNKQQPPPVHHDEVRQNKRREMHPAAADAVARYSAVFDENELLRNENAELLNANEVLRRVDAEKSAIVADLRRIIDETQRAATEQVRAVEDHYRGRLTETERAKERYLRYAVSIAERLKACGDQIAAAHDTAMKMATDEGKVAAIEQEMREFVAAQQKASGGGQDENPPEG